MNDTTKRLRMYGVWIWNCVERPWHYVMICRLGNKFVKLYLRMPITLIVEKYPTNVKIVLI